MRPRNVSKKSTAAAFLATKPDVGPQGQNRISRLCYCCVFIIDPARLYESLDIKNISIEDKGGFSANVAFGEPEIFIALL